MSLCVQSRGDDETMEQLSLVCLNRPMTKPERGRGPPEGIEGGGGRWRWVGRCKKTVGDVEWTTIPQKVMCRDPVFGRFVHAPFFRMEAEKRTAEWSGGGGGGGGRKFWTPRRKMMC